MIRFPEDRDGFCVRRFEFNDVLAGTENLELVFPAGFKNGDIEVFDAFHPCGGAFIIGVYDGAVNPVDNIAVLVENAQIPAFFEMVADPLAGFPVVAVAVEENDRSVLNLQNQENDRSRCRRNLKMKAADENPKQFKPGHRERHEQGNQKNVVAV